MSARVYKSLRGIQGRAFMPAFTVRQATESPILNLLRGHKCPPYLTLFATKGDMYARDYYLQSTVGRAFMPAIATPPSQPWNKCP